MLLMASASTSTSDHRHHRHGAAKSYPPPASPALPSPSKVPAEKPTARAGPHGFSFSWGTHRRLRCSKDGAPVVHDSASPSPPPPSKNPHTPSPDKAAATPNPPPTQDAPAATTGCSPRPQRPARNLRSLLRNAASRPVLQSPAAPAAQAKPRRKRGFAVALTTEEIARDFAAIRRCTTRPVPPARRAKKLPKSAQDAINMMCPGSSLVDLDLDNYKIDERINK